MTFHWAEDGFVLMIGNFGIYFSACAQTDTQAGHCGIHWYTVEEMW